MLNFRGVLNCIFFLVNKFVDYGDGNLKKHNSTVDKYARFSHIHASIHKNTDEAILQEAENVSDTLGRDFGARDVEMLKMIEWFDELHNRIRHLDKKIF